MARNPRIPVASPPWYDNVLVKVGIGLLLLLIVGAVVLGTKVNRLGGQQEVPVVGGPAQEVRISVDSYEYNPDTFTVTAGQPVRLVVDATNARGCAISFTIPSQNIDAMLARGENVFEFTPTKRGRYPFSCSMNMVRGTMNVV